MKYYFYDILGYNTSIFLIINQLAQYNIILIFCKTLAFILEIKLWIMTTIGLALIVLYNQKITLHQLRLLVSFYIFTIVFTLAKNIAHYTRPFCEIKGIITEYTFTFDCFSSFPSAHAGLAVWIVYNFKVNFYLSIFFVILTAMSRIILCVHYPTDTVYGAAMAFVILRIFDKIPNKWLCLLVHIFNKFSKRTIKILDF